MDAFFKQGLITVYLTNGKEHEREYVINNTVFVVAQYFAWVEIIRTEIQFIDFRSLENTKELSELQDHVYSLWQTDMYDDSFRIWAGEQRAIGELMIEKHNDKLTCIGYAGFLKKLQGNNEQLFLKLQADVAALSGNGTTFFPRLKAIHKVLIDTLYHLDPEYMRFPKDCRSYISSNA